MADQFSRVPQNNKFFPIPSERFLRGKILSFFLSSYLSFLSLAPHSHTDFSSFKDVHMYVHRHNLYNQCRYTWEPTGGRVTVGRGQELDRNSCGGTNPHVAPLLELCLGQYCMGQHSGLTVQWILSSFLLLGASTRIVLKSIRTI